MYPSHSATSVRLVVFALALMWLTAGCISSRRIQDYTVARSSICEVHGLPMKEKLVPQTFGMRRGEWINELRFARRDTFPHAGEVYDTYACQPSYERYARIYVCPECTTARTKWLADHPPDNPDFRQYIRQCDTMAKQFRQSFRGGE